MRREISSLVPVRNSHSSSGEIDLREALHVLRRVVLGVDRDRHEAGVVGVLRLLDFQVLDQPADPGAHGGALLDAAGEDEADDPGTAEQVLAGDGLAVLIDQRKIVDVVRVPDAAVAGFVDRDRRDAGSRGVSVVRGGAIRSPAGQSSSGSAAAVGGVS